MTDVVFVTYATHAQGMFHELVHNSIGVRVHVVGWISPWRGYVQSKILGIHSFVSQLPGDTLVCYVDGFDSKFNKSTSHMRDTFFAMGADIVNLAKRDGTSQAYVVSYPFAVGQSTNYKIERFCRDYTAQAVVVLVTVVVLSMIFVREAHCLQRRDIP